MALILNEIKEAETILINGEIGNKPSSTLFLLAKYYRQYMQYSAKDTEGFLHKFMSLHYPNYNSVLWEDIIENISKNANKHSIRNVDHIGITQKELDYIKLLNNIDYEKLVFTLLCYAKLHNLTNENNNSWANCKIPELFKIARVNVRYKNDKFFMLHYIKNILLLKTENSETKEPLISFSKKNDNLNIKVNFIDDSDDYVLIISDFRELGYEYLLYLGGNYSRCETCDILFKQNKNKTYKYCFKHRGYQPQESKIIKCIDCGKEVVVDSKANNRKRCDSCTQKAKLEKYRKYNEKRKNK